MGTTGKRNFEHAMIESPGRRLLAGVPLKFVRERASGRRKRGLNAALNLTSFIDFLIVVVVFLLMTFSVSGNMPPDRSVELPYARNPIDMVEAPIVSVTGNQVMVDGTAVGTTRSIEEAGRVLRVDSLHRALKNQRELWHQLNPKRKFPGVAVLQIDRRVPALVVKSVFMTAAESGYPDIALAVQPMGGAGAH